jgi:hypothetical protein
VPRAGTSTMVSCPCRARVVLFRAVPVLAHRAWPIWPSITPHTALQFLITERTPIFFTKYCQPVLDEPLIKPPHSVSLHLLYGNGSLILRRLRGTGFKSKKRRRKGYAAGAEGSRARAGRSQGPQLGRTVKGVVPFPAGVLVVLRRPGRRPYQTPSRERMNMRCHCQQQRGVGLCGSPVRAGRRGQAAYLSLPCPARVPSHKTGGSRGSPLLPTC